MDELAEIFQCENIKNVLKICHTILKDIVNKMNSGYVQFRGLRVIAINRVSLSLHKDFHMKSLITLPFISKKSYLSFSIHNLYPIGLIMIPLTLYINKNK